MAEQAYFGFQQQTFHYFTRSHHAPPDDVIASDADWRGADMVEEPDWRYQFTSDDIAELETALAHAKSLNKKMGALTKQDFPLPRLSAEIDRWRAAIVTGRGFQVMSGLPVDRWGEEDASIAYWCLGLHLGRPGAQNVHDDLLGHVRDTGADKSDPFVRQYLTTQNIPFHCDAADVVGLLCLKKAKHGGASRIASSVRIFNELRTRRPDLAAVLFDPFPLDVREENDAGLKSLPIPPCRFADGVLRTFYHAEYFRTSSRHDGVSLTPVQAEALDLYDAISNEPGVALNMDLEPGDVQLLSNHLIVHARSDYEDHDDPAEKRHLLRLWLSIV